MAAERCRNSDSDRPLGRKRRRIISSDARINNLGDDLLVEILFRLHPRIACRCKLVCQLWRSVISAASFNRLLVSRLQTMSPNDLKLMVLSFIPPMPNGVEDRDALKVLDCDRDLVLCGFWDTENMDKKHGRAYLVCNPFTKQWNALPLAPRKLAAYHSSVSRLVCEPSGYRFRVVCMYVVRAFPSSSIRLDLFCSESGNWTKDALVRDSHSRLSTKSLVSCNGELFWTYFEPRPMDVHQSLAVFNPFRLDLPPTSIDVSAFLAKPQWTSTVCQDALHLVVQENKCVPVRLSVWRLGKDRKSWRKQCEGLVKLKTKCGNYEVRGFYQPFLHPQKPEIVFFNWLDSYKFGNVVLCCDLRRGELELFTKLEERPEASHFMLFNPRASSWFTPIPDFDEARGKQKSGDQPTSSFNNEQCSIRHGVPSSNQESLLAD
ncbi:unnamed protein product [Linum tenue]|uniref:F-box domain-containing protein n=2 Tax=Linum tenue TaxID=586396 RepID=A0AAV0JUW2_9ROSI|nr:unnamed protein product [Linum tenue]